MKPPRMRNHGLTLMELLFALFAMSFLGLAISSLMVAAGDAWQTRNTFVDQNQTIRVVTMRLGQWIRDSKRVVNTESVGNRTDILIWANDDQFPGEVNLGELQVLSFDRSSGTLTFYRFEMNQAQLADSGINQSLYPTDLAEPGYAATLRARSDLKSYVLADQIADLSAELGQIYSGQIGSFLEIRVVFDMPEGYADQVALISAACRAPDNQIEFFIEG